MQEPKHGTSRQMLALALARFSGERPIRVLINLLRDNDVNGHAVMALGKLGAPMACGPGIEDRAEGESATPGEQDAHGVEAGPKNRGSSGRLRGAVGTG